MSTLHAGKVATVAAEFFASSPLNPQAFGLAHSPLPLGMRTCLMGWEQTNVLVKDSTAAQTKEMLKRRKTQHIWRHLNKLQHPVLQPCFGKPQFNSPVVLVLGDF